MSWEPCPATPCWAMINYTDGKQIGDEAQAHYANFHGCDHCCCVDDGGGCCHCSDWLEMRE